MNGWAKIKSKYIKVIKDEGFWDWIIGSYPEGYPREELPRIGGLEMTEERALELWHRQYQKALTAPPIPEEEIPEEEIPEGKGSFPTVVALPSGETIGIGWEYTTDPYTGEQISLPILSLQDVTPENLTYIFENYGDDYDKDSLGLLANIASEWSIIRSVLRPEGITASQYDADPGLQGYVRSWASGKAIGAIPDEEGLKGLEQKIAKPSGYKPTAPEGFCSLSENIDTPYCRWKRQIEADQRRRSEASLLIKKGYEETGRIAPITGGLAGAEQRRAYVQPGSYESRIAALELTEAQRQQALGGIKLEHRGGFRTEVEAKAYEGRAIEAAALTAVPRKKRKKPAKPMSAAQIAKQEEWLKLVEASRKPTKVVSF